MGRAHKTQKWFCALSLLSIGYFHKKPGKVSIGPYTLGPTPVITGVERRPLILPTCCPVIWRIVPRPNISAFPFDARCVGNTGTAVRFLFPKRPRCPSTEKNKSSIWSFTKGRRNEPSRPREKKPESDSVSVPSAGGWSVMPAFSSVMKWICAGSAPGA